MKSSIFRTVCAVAVTLILVLSSNSHAVVGVGDIAPEISSTQTFNAPTRRVSIGQFRGRVVLIDFWATWCGPCVATIPHLQKLHDKYASKGLVVIGQTDGSSRNLAQFIKQKKMTYIISVGAQLAPPQYAVRGIPHAVVIAPDGKILWKGHPGALQEQVIQQALTKVKLSGGPLEYPKFETRSSDRTVALAQKSIMTGRVGSSLARLRKIVEVNRNQDQVTEAKPVIETVESWYEAKLAEADKALEKGDAVAAYKIYGGLAKAMAGTAEAAKLNKKKTEARATEAYKLGVQYYRLVAKVARASSAIQKKSYASFAKEHPDTYYGKLAAEQAQ